MEEQPVQKKYIFNGKGALALIGGLLAGSSAVALLNVVLMFVFKVNIQYTDYFLILLNSAGFLGAIFAFDYFICRPSIGKKLSFNMSTTNLMTYLLVFPMMFGMMLIAEFITSQIPVTGPFFGPLYDYYTKLMEQMTANTSTMIILAVFLAPVFEEIIFRGIIMKGLINKGMKPLKAILISAVIFGIVHQNPWQFIGAVLLGVVLGMVYHKTKSLLLPMLLHGFNNLVSTVLILYTDSESFSDAFHLPEWIIFTAGIVLFTTFYLLFTRRYRVIYLDN